MVALQGAMSAFAELKSTGKTSPSKLDGKLIFNIATPRFRFSILHVTKATCGSHICVAYLALWRRAPIQTTSAHRAVQNSSRQSPFVDVTVALCGTHSLRATRLKRIERTDNMERYARVTYIRVRSCLVNSELDSIVVIRFGVRCECVRVQCDMLWCENECSYLPCNMLWRQNECSHVPYNMLWCAKCMFTCNIHYALVWKMNVCMYHVICFGVQNECLHVAYLFAVLSWTVGNNCPSIETNSNHQRV